MPGIAVAGMDTAGGMIQSTQTKVRYKGLPIAVVGCPIENHGRSPHNAAVMEQGSSKVRVNGVPICLAGARASCDHVCTGRPDIRSSM